MQDKNVIKLTDGAALLEQGASILEGLENDERNRGNCSTAEGAGCSAHAVRRLASALPAHDREIGQCLHQTQEPAPAQAVHPTFMVHTGDSKVTLHFSSEAETLEFYRTQPQAASAAVAVPAQALTGEARAEAINRLVPIRAKLAAAAAAVAVSDERAAFEAWAKSEDMSTGSDCDGYIHPNTAAASLAWQARAALAATPAANSVELHQIKTAAPVVLPEPDAVLRVVVDGDTPSVISFNTLTNGEYGVLLRLHSARPAGYCYRTLPAQADARIDSALQDAM